ncbi:hypothetical protein FBZ98_1011028 [Rhizobium sp. ERR 922]|uniref:hypothetical protein n=1 Tax=unclassified Rhizobium TaxID=2613769 RepID=UPI0011AAC21C|nr:MULTISPECIES: hypothetical protein [unclassified Rhizobium]TWB61683.1 hypothetical protein FBZ98_1011028 [Rhizobium sp. ERR 922]TWC04609.1 hypothetical protein FBZ97_1011028 [Rhizobium sp. ERR 942]
MTATFRIETVFDDKTGLYFAEVYSPGDAKEPFEKTKPIYASHESAEREVLEMFRKTFKGQPMKVRK